MNVIEREREREREKEGESMHDTDREKKREGESHQCLAENVKKKFFKVLTKKNYLLVECFYYLMIIDH